MRFLLATLAALPFVSCAPAPPARSVRKPEIIEKTPVVATPTITPAAPSAPAGTPHFTTRKISEITFEGVEFDSRNHRLVVADQPDGPGSKFADATAAGNARGGIAAVNAGFFTPEGAPLGLVVSAGKTTGAWNSASSLGSGIWFENPSGGTGITRRETLGRPAAARSRELIQAGPLLVENGQAVSGLEAAKTSARIVILWDGGTRWWIGKGSPCSLADLGRALASGQPAGWKVRHALNLDGGRSADIWVSGSVSGGPFANRPPWNRPVRNFLVLVQR
ncbi:MAG: phosphodiester glycosidase family protein [Verrucomicrobiota bacterium]